MEYSAETRSPSRQSLGSGHKSSIGSFKQARQILSKPSLRFKLASPPTITTPGFIEHPSLSLPHDIGDSTWIQGLENSGYLNSGDILSSSLKTRVPPPPPITRPRGESAPAPPIHSSSLLPAHQHRPSLDSLSSTASPTSSNSTDSTMRRQAKTPIFRIGHIGKKSSKAGAMTRRQAADAAGKTRSIDLIADSYNAILESRDALEYEALFGDMSPQDDYSSDQRPETMILATEEPQRIHYPPQSRSLQRPSRPQRLPTNDNGELIGFEEDAIYFKPVSFSPEPSPPSRRQQFDRRSPSPPRMFTESERRVSKEKCEEMLEDEICKTVTESSLGTTPENSALQLGIMIKTYEKLRDQVAKKEGHSSETRVVKSAFDSWLTALTSVHEKMINEAGGRDLEESVDILPRKAYHY